MTAYTPYRRHLTTSLRQERGTQGLRVPTLRLAGLSTEDVYIKDISLLIFFLSSLCILFPSSPTYSRIDSVSLRTPICLYRALLDLSRDNGPTHHGNVRPVAEVVCWWLFAISAVGMSLITELNNGLGQPWDFDIAIDAM